MTSGDPGDHEPNGFDYATLVRTALLGVVRQVLARAAAEGLAGDHHFYLTFRTTEEGVVLSPRLLKQFAEEMTIVLQHQFWGLAVDDHGFEVTLRFGGTPERLVVPWTALRAFADPSVGFGLRLQEAAPPAEPQPASGDAEPASGPRPVANADATANAEAPQAVPPQKVVDLGRFRRRRTDPEPEDRD